MFTPLEMHGVDKIDHRRQFDPRVFGIWWKVANRLFVFLARSEFRWEKSILCNGGGQKKKKKDSLVMMMAGYKSVKNLTEADSFMPLQLTGDLLDCQIFGSNLKLDFSIKKNFTECFICLFTPIWIPTDIVSNA